MSREKLEMDHWCLQWLMRASQNNSKLARWALKLQEVDFIIRHRRGGNAAALARPPIACPENGTVMVFAAVFCSDDNNECVAYHGGSASIDDAEAQE